MCPLISALQTAVLMLTLAALALSCEQKMTECRRVGVWGLPYLQIDNGHSCRSQDSRLNENLMMSLFVQAKTSTKHPGTQFCCFSCLVSESKAIKKRNLLWCEGTKNSCALKSKGNGSHLAINERERKWQEASKAKVGKGDCISLPAPARLEAKTSYTHQF